MNTDPPVSPPRLSDEELLNMGVHPDARGLIEMMRDLSAGASAAYGWAKRKGRLVLSDKRNVGIAVLVLALLTVSFIAFGGHGTTATQIAPQQPATATEAPSNAPRKHTVKNGEHLASIGKLYGVSRMEMIEANHDIVAVDKLKIGQIVNVPVPQMATNEK